MLLVFLCLVSHLFCDFLAAANKFEVRTIDMLPPALMETACKDMARVDFQIDLSSESAKKIVQSFGSLRAIHDFFKGTVRFVCIMLYIYF